MRSVIVHDDEVTIKKNNQWVSVPVPTMLRFAFNKNSKTRQVLTAYWNNCKVCGTKNKRQIYLYLY